MDMTPTTADKIPENGAEIESYIAQLEERQTQESIFAQITAGFNSALTMQVVLQTLQEALHDLGYKYLSIWEKRGEYLYWNRGAIELPQWLIEKLPELATQYIQERPIDIRVSLGCESIYSNCYHQHIPQSTQNNKEIIECLYLGNTPFNDLPGWLKRAGEKMMTRLDVREHNAFPLGDYGLLFLSNPKTLDSEKHKAWVEIILQQAEVAIARIQAVEELKVSKARYQALFDRTNDAVFILSLDMIHLAVNQQAADMLGYSVDELIGMHSKVIIAPEEWENTQDRRTTLAHGEIPPLYLRTFIKKDGSRVLTEVSVALVYDSQGNPSHYHSIARDITEREKIQEQLHLQATALENAANGIVITNREGIILWANQAITNLTGFSENEVLGNTPNMFRSGRQTPAFYKELWDAITNGLVWQGEIINKRKDGTLYTEAMTITPVHGLNDEITNFIAIKQDITQQVQAKEMLEYLATHDSLTKIANRSLFMQRLEHAILQAKRNGQNLAILFVDLDDFKSVNDSYGHEMGDFVLELTARRLVTSIRESDTAARFGGDEFTILLENIAEQENAAMLAQKLFDSISAPISISGQSISISASIGISTYPDDSQDAETLLKYADQAMYATKDAGKKGYQFFTKT